MAKKVTKKAVKKKPTTRQPRNVATEETITAKAAASRTTSARTKPSAKANGSLQPAPNEERIRERAYEIYRAGRNGSDPTADWIQAERELRAELGA